MATNSADVTRSLRDTTDDTRVRRPVSRGLVLLVWAGLALLLLIGIAGSAMRALHLGDFFAMLQPLRNATFAMFGISNPDPVRQAAMVARADSKFAAHAVATLLHVGSGTLLFALVPLQFSKVVRSRFRAFHRWSGRLLVVIAWVAGLGGLYFGVLHPLAGVVERVIVGLIGIWFLSATSIAFLRIRQGRTAEHREWMLRAVAAALGISTMRLVGIPVDLVLTPLGVGPEVAFLHTIWIGWSVTPLTAEWWIRRTRPSVKHSS